MCRATSLIAIAMTFSSSARAERPVLADEATYSPSGSEIVVHYSAVGVDAVPTADSNSDGVPDFIFDVAREADLATAHYRSLGFRPPLSDGALGGDGRIDIYLRDLDAADGNAGTDSCANSRCVGFVVAENDYVGFAYPSISEAIRSVVPHELFHLVQYAYAAEQPSTWTEATAVWAVEQLYGDANGDFERFLPAFLTRTYRPFERTVGGFGDAYPYGAALWPYFIEQTFGIDVVVAAWSACEQSPIFDAIDATLVARGSSVEEAWVEFTRRNALTGRYATTGGYRNAVVWSEAPREPIVSESATIYVEGLSARYVPMMISAESQLEVTPTNGIDLAAWLIEDGAPFERGEPLELVGGRYATAVSPGNYTLVITGLSRGTITTPVGISLRESLDKGGCAAASPHSLAPAAFAFILLWRRRWRRDC